MADISLIDTTFTAKNISTAISVYEYTVPGTGLIYKLRFQVRLYQVAGGGDYTINLRLNDGDAQADDPIVPTTTYTAAAGTQNMWLTGISVDGMSGDVFNVMVLGQAGDTAVTGSIRIFADDAVGVTTYGRTLDVTSTGEAGLDFANVNSLATIYTTALTESYAADGAAPTIAQALFAIQQFLQERSVSGTTLTVKKIDGSTSAMTFTLSDATSPTSLTRAT